MGILHEPSCKPSGSTEVKGSVLSNPTNTRARCLAIAQASKKKDCAEVSFMTSDMDVHVQQVVAQVPGADPKKVEEAFVRYEKDFMVPPEDAFRSVLRRFQSDLGEVKPATGGASSSAALPNRKVNRFSELKGDDRNIEIEVKITTHNPRVQMIRGEEKQIAFGSVEDMPWAEGEGELWDYKDWGHNQNLSPGAIVRLEGVSVNEYQGKMSLNINQSSRIVVLQEGSRDVVNPSEPVEISSVKGEGMVTVVGRVLASREDVIHRKDGSGTLDVVRGRIGDDSGVIGFLSWEPFTHEVGSLVKIQHAQVRSFRNTPELNIGRSTKVEVYRDTNFTSLDDLSVLTVSKIEDLTDGNRDVECVVEVQNILVRTFSKEGGEEGKVWSGEVADPTGRCRMSCWQQPPFTEADLPVIVKITGARVRAWQGIPDITVDSAEQIELLASPPWEKDLDLSENVVEVELNSLTSGASRVGISTAGTIVSIRDDSGLIRRCSDCKRVLREGACATHGEQEGVEDVRLRMVLDDGSATLSLIVNRDACLTLLSSTEDEIKDRITADGQAVFVQSLRERMLGRKLTAVGRTIVDEQGAMLLAESCTIEVVDTVLLAAELRQHWGVA